ncbi:MAG: exodeoxyribonuclease VII small subunit [Clostridia bacterium]|nr:exodeoxyribonuclease VII small subunit [Clostridia bacterium]
MAEKMKFEDALERIESIVKSLEDGKCDLADSLALFEEGVSLIKLCNTELEEAEQKVRMLSGKDDDGGETL